MTDPQTLIAPLRAFVKADFTNLVQETQEQKLVGEYHALQSIQLAFEGLISRKRSALQSPEFDALEQALTKCHVGFVAEDKASKLQISASLGYVHWFVNDFYDQRMSPDDIVLVFCFGPDGGGVEAFASSERRGIEKRFEIKPKEAPSPNDCSLGDYVPNSKPKSLITDRALLFSLIDATHHEVNALGPFTKVVRASILVTGPIREFIFRENSQSTIDALFDYMKPIRHQSWPMSPFTQNYALNHQHEVEYEDLACNAMYSTLRKSKRIGNYEVIEKSLCGIDDNKCQLLFGLRLATGLKQLDQDCSVNAMAHQMITHLGASPKNAALFVQLVNHAIAARSLPLIPFQAGFLSLLNNKQIAPKTLDAITKANNMVQRTNRQMTTREALLVKYSIGTTLAQTKKVLIDNIEQSFANFEFDPGLSVASFHIAETTTDV